MRLIFEPAFNWIWYRPNQIKWLLWPLAAIYRMVMGIRRLQYRLGLKPVVTLPVPVIVVGNMTVGGTGKNALSYLASFGTADAGLSGRHRQSWLWRRYHRLASAGLEHQRPATGGR